MRGDGADAGARDIEGEVDRALRRPAVGAPASAEASGGRALRLLGQVEEVAFGELLEAVAALKAARQLGDEGKVARARMGMTDALEMYSRARWTRLEAEQEHAGPPPLPPAAESSCEHDALEMVLAGREVDAERYMAQWWTSRLDAFRAKLRRLSMLANAVADARPAGSGKEGTGGA